MARSTNTASISASPPRAGSSGACLRRAKSPRGSLAGHYGGVTGEVEIGLGLGANVLLGGSNKQVALQPLSITGGIGLNVAAGIASLTLEAGK